MSLHLPVSFHSQIREQEKLKIRILCKMFSSFLVGWAESAQTGQYTAGDRDV